MPRKPRGPAPAPAAPPPAPMTPPNRPALPPEYLGVRDVCADLGITSGNAFNMRKTRDPYSVPPMIKIKGRLAITREDYAAWKADRHRRQAVELSQSLAAQARERRQEAARLDQAAREALEPVIRDAAAS